MTQKKYWTEVAQHNRKRHADIDRANRKPRQEEPGIRGKVYSIYKEKGIDGVKEFIKNNKGEFSGYSEEFAIKMLQEYEGKTFKNILSEDVGNSEEDEKIAEQNKLLLEEIKNSLGDKVSKVKITTSLKSHAVCLSSEGEISLEMEKVLSSQPNGGQGIKAEKVLELNPSHPIFEKLKKVYIEDKEGLSSYAEVLYFVAGLMAGIEVEKPSEVAEKIFEIISK